MYQWRSNGENNGPNGVTGNGGYWHIVAAMAKITYEDNNGNGIRH
jgi:hypothetical protein